MWRKVTPNRQQDSYKQFFQNIKTLFNKPKVCIRNKIIYVIYKLQINVKNNKG